MRHELIYEIDKLLNNQPGLEKIDIGEEYIIQGKYIYSLDYNGHVAQGEKNIEIKVHKDFPNSIPKFYVFDYPEQIDHIYEDNEVCLATIGELIYFLNEHPSLLAFIEKFVNAFIYTIDWFEIYKTYPFGDRKHGYRGLLDYYLNDLMLSKDQYRVMIRMILHNKYRGHHSCICGSGKRLRNCHGKYILPIIKNESYKSNFLNEACMIATKDGKNVK